MTDQLTIDASTVWDSVNDAPGVTLDGDGCPDPDNDKDGVLDAKDKCPDEPETINGIKDKDGCPDKGAVKVLVTKDRIEIKDKKIANYQAVVPTTWNASPRDDDGNPGPIEQALIGTKVRDKDKVRGKVRARGKVRGSTMLAEPGLHN